MVPYSYNLDIVSFAPTLPQHEVGNHLGRGESDHVADLRRSRS